MKLRRDEVDVLTNSSRKGWRNRKPTKDILEMYNNFKNYDFDKMSELVIRLFDSEIDLDAQLFENSANKNADFLENIIIKL